jgi:Flp pilus assembly protein TadB
MSSVRAMSDVLSDLFSNLQEIVRAELQLAKTEARDELRSARPAGILVAAGALGMCFGAFFILLCIVLALSLVLPAWAASLIVGVVLGILAVVTLNHGVRRFHRHPRPAPRTVASVKENIEWVKPRNR